jgi:general secretion pathway protein G
MGVLVSCKTQQGCNIFGKRGKKMKRKNFPENSRRGFTLVELLVVMVIIGLLAALVAPRLFPKLGKGKQAAAKAQIELLGQALDQYRLDVGSYPTTQEGLKALMTNPGVEKWEGPYLKKTCPRIPGARNTFTRAPGRTENMISILTAAMENRAGKGRTAT